MINKTNIGPFVGQVGDGASENRQGSYSMLKNNRIEVENSGD